MVVRGKAADEANWVVPQEHGSCPLKDKGFLLFGKYEKGVAADDVAMAMVTGGCFDKDIFGVRREERQGFP